MKKIIFATNNCNKVDEIRMILGNTFEIISLVEAGITIDIPEPYFTLKENATEKARVIHQLTGENCFSEDTGLEVDVLNGAPGVFSARYAGEQAKAKDNIKKLLMEMEGKENRKAHFKTCICLILDGQTFFFEGKCEGVITTKESGKNGFGYDPVFIPSGHNVTFAEMDPMVKAKISHRKLAVAKMTDFLLNQMMNK